MPVDPHANFAYSTVATAPSPATSGLSLVVQAGEGARFPAVPFNATVWPAGSSPLSSNAEIVRVTGISTDTLTITRAQESTSAKSIAVGYQIAATVTAKTLTDVEQAIIAGFCGDGSDGNVTISGTTTLTRDMFYDTLTVQSGGILDTAGFRVYCKTLCQVNSGGTIRRNGTNASGTAAASLGNGSIGGGIASGAGATGNGGNATNSSNMFGGLGGNGGTGSGSFGGFGGGVAPVAALGTVRSLPQSAVGHLYGISVATTFLGGGGGGGGGGDATNLGGAGGSGGGVVIINARAVINNGAITATGGNGRTQTVGNVGGGGAGGGGVVIINTASFTGTTPTAAAGTPGSGVGTGTIGLAGSAGTVLVNVWN